MFLIISCCVLVMKLERSGSFKLYMLLLLKKVSVEPLISTCWGLWGLIVNKFGLPSPNFVTGSKLN